MEGSLLYHMAMVSKMSAESKIVLEELKAESPSVEEKTRKFYSDFVSDAKELLKGVAAVDETAVLNPENWSLTVQEKIQLFKNLSEQTKIVEEMLDQKDAKAKEAIQKAFSAWAEQIVLMRLGQEFETIKGFLIVEKLC